MTKLYLKNLVIMYEIYINISTGRRAQPKRLPKLLITVADEIVINTQICVFLVLNVEKICKYWMYNGEKNA